MSNIYILMLQENYTTNFDLLVVNVIKNYSVFHYKVSIFIYLFFIDLIELAVNSLILLLNHLSIFAQKFVREDT